MTDRNYTHIVAVLDRSGSMISAVTDTEGGFDTFIKEQAEQPGKCTVTLVRFDTEYDVVYSNLPISEVPPLQLSPRGSTALNDALGKAIVDTGAELAKMPEESRPGMVIVLVLTDGMENASREYSVEAVKKLIETQTEEYSWVFTYIGANQDAVLTGGQYGFNPGLSMTYNTDATLDAYTGLSQSISGTRSAVASGVPVAFAAADNHYTDEQREAANNSKKTKQVSSK